MSISVMKQALRVLNHIQMSIGTGTATIHCDSATWHDSDAAITALRQAIAEAEKQEPVVIGEEWKPCVKLPVVVHVREQRKGETHVSTREGITPVKEDDLIMRGVAGEEYPIGRELFNRTYTFDTAPVHASGISAERVDETAKDRHEPESNNVEIAAEQSDNYAAFLAGVRFARVSLPAPSKEWVGLTQTEFEETVDGLEDLEDCWQALEAKLKEKNNG